ncbi:hypothetical protein TWF730_008447 [Orbilia blumenaviensis]|uniref:Uncharacterized protein n=1 Tax=Orbilia blumenaviensis TaxID=1796055 RepID=A0AAV9V5K5_9PEZI
MSLAIETTIEYFCASMDTEIIEVSAFLDPLEDKLAAIKRQLFEFFYPYIQDLKDGKPVSGETGYPIDVTCVIPKDKVRLVLEKRRGIVDVWGYHLPKIFNPIVEQVLNLENRYKEKSNFLEQQYDQALEADSRGKIGLYAHLLYPAALDSLMSQGKLLQKLRQKIEPVTKRFNDLQAIATTAWELVDIISELPESAGLTTQNKFSKGPTWKFSITLDEHWTNELEMLNIQLHDNIYVKKKTMSGKAPKTAMPKDYRPIKLIENIFASRLEYVNTIVVEDLDTGYATSLASWIPDDVATTEPLPRKRRLSDEHATKESAQLFQQPQILPSPTDLSKRVCLAPVQGYQTHPPQHPIHPTKANTKRVSRKRG